MEVAGSCASVSQCIDGNSSSNWRSSGCSNTCAAVLADDCAVVGSG